jgi:hypothetical protein
MTNAEKAGGDAVSAATTRSSPIATSHRIALIEVMAAGTPRS